MELSSSFHSKLNWNLNRRKRRRWRKNMHDKVIKEEIHFASNYFYDIRTLHDFHFLLFYNVRWIYIFKEKKKKKRKERSESLLQRVWIKEGWRFIYDVHAAEYIVFTHTEEVTHDKILFMTLHCDNFFLFLVNARQKKDPTVRVAFRTKKWIILLTKDKKKVKDFRGGEITWTKSDNKFTKNASPSHKEIHSKRNVNAAMKSVV